MDPSSAFDYLNSGSLVFSASLGRNGYPWTLMLLDLKTRNARYLVDYSNGNNALAPHWSPDGRYLLYSINRDCAGIYAYDFAQDRVQRLDKSTEEEGDCQAVWSPDGTRIAYVSHRDTVNGYYPNLSVLNFSTGEHRVLTSLSAGNPTWMPGGEWIIYYSHKRDLRLYRIRSDGSEDQEFFRLPDTRLRIKSICFSPNREKMAFAGWVWDDGNTKAADWAKSQLYTANADGTNIELLVPEQWFNCIPVWSPGGDAIAVVGSMTEMYGVASIFLVQNGEMWQLVPETYDERECWFMWSPDGRYIAYTPLNRSTLKGSGISVIEVSTGHTAHFMPELTAAYPVWRPVL